MKLILLSDTHGFLDARIAALASACDIAVHAGDIGASGVLKMLAPRDRVVAVRGNNDTLSKWPAGEDALLRALPTVTSLDLPGGSLVVIHGDSYPAKNRHARLRADFPQAQAVVYGHSHRLICDCASYPWILNPGAAGRTRTFEGPSCLILQAIDEGTWRVAIHRFPRSGDRAAGRPKPMARP